MVRQAASEVARPYRERGVLRYAALVGLAAVLVVAGLGLWSGRLSLPSMAAAVPTPAAATPTPGATPTVAAPEAIPVAAAVSPVPTTSAAPSPLAPILLTLDHDRSFQSAVGQIQALWGPDPLERTSLRTHIEQVRRLNLPVVLEMFHPSRRDTCFMALIRLEGDQAVLAAEGAPLNVPLAEVDRLWTRQAVFLWRDFDALTPGGDPQRTKAWVRQTLARLGYPAQDPDLSQTVARFQQDAELAADGVVGTRTLMTLYSRSHYPRPRLSGGTS
jgi:hypothetical protein